MKDFETCNMALGLINCYSCRTKLVLRQPYALVRNKGAFGIKDLAIPSRTTDYLLIRFFSLQSSASKAANATLTTDNTQPEEPWQKKEKTKFPIVYKYNGWRWIWCRNQGWPSTESDPDLAVVTCGSCVLFVQARNAIF